MENPHAVTLTVHCETLQPLVTAQQVVLALKSVGGLEASFRFAVTMTGDGAESTTNGLRTVMEELQRHGIQAYFEDLPRAVGALGSTIQAQKVVRAILRLHDAGEPVTTANITNHTLMTFDQVDAELKPILDAGLLTTSPPRPGDRFAQHVATRDGVTQLRAAVLNFDPTAAY